MGIRKFFGFRSNKPIGWANRKSRFVTALSLGIGNESTKMRRTIMYAAIVIMILGPLFYGLKEDLSILDTIYFLVIMWTTVGYGDIVPDEGASRDFTVFYLCLSVLLVGAVMAISREYQAVVRKKGEWDQSQVLAESMRQVKLEDEKVANTDDSISSSTNSEVDAIPPAPGDPPKRRKTARSSLTAVVEKAKRRISVLASSRSRMKRSKETLSHLQKLNIDVYNEEIEDIAWGMLCDLLVFILVNLIAAGVMCGLEDWQYDAGLYWAIVTITTVGLGDFTPQTKAGKVFTIFFAIFGVFYVQSALNELAQYPMMLMSKRNEIKIIDQFGPAMDEEQAESLINNDFFRRVPSLKADEPDAQSKLSKAEFVLLVLNMMDKVKEKDAILLCALFDSLDSNHDGQLTHADVEEKLKAVRRRSTKLADAAQKGLPPPSLNDDDDDDFTESSTADELGLAMKDMSHSPSPSQSPSPPKTKTKTRLSFSKKHRATYEDDGSSDDGMMSSKMVTQRRPTFMAAIEERSSEFSDADGRRSSMNPMQQNPPLGGGMRPLSQLFARAEGPGETGNIGNQDEINIKESNETY